MAGAGPANEGRYGERVFRPEDRGEDDRIDLGALAYDETTMARLRQLGVGPGWTCLEVGAGTGTVARRLLGEAGVAQVLAVDRDVRFLAAHPVPGLTTLQADITSEDFSPGLFRLVHARFVLMHLPSPQQMVSRLAGLVAPGGVLVVSDAVDLTTDSAPVTPYTRAMRAMWQGLRDSIGTDVSQVTHRTELLQAAGLEAVAAEIHVPPLLPGSAISRFWADTWGRARAAMVATGLVDDAQLDEAVRYLDSPGCTGLSPGMLTAWGWKAEDALAPERPTGEHGHLTERRG
ncbi:class I SAM-dependent methyltransferase [Streptomyces sp. NBC_00162]|uniref:class I SAM-dependent methyltransferase n=1 Tax=Streptomyces sp. NBC_00162 TaxID=2903629 RepID=UPI00214D0561|nr:class I SAM-dependent methyltransferase [Streptomyces sp. NBC_00162]UUU43893.1 methyltransferase domain-containing protein [Streptomyces sp. NBC_00162]